MRRRTRRPSLKAKGESVYGLFWLSGSNKTELLERTQESLVGRVAFLEMSMLSKEEIEGRDEEVFDPLFKDVTKRNGPVLKPHELYQKNFRGGYPELYDHPEKTLMIFTHHISTPTLKKTSQV
jgi:predicted AAA+ superfamily ATPase